VASGQAAAKARHARRHLDDAGAQLQQPQPNGRELGCGERVSLRNRVSNREHKPIGCRVQDEPHLIG
jgi:hypothetical protein